MVGGGAPEAWDRSRHGADWLPCRGRRSRQPGLLYPAGVSADRERSTESGIPIKPVYRAQDAPPERPAPGAFPYTRGVRPDGYRERPWTMRQYAGFSSAEETNSRFRLLLDRGQTGLSVAFDLPTQLGLDSDHPLARGEVGRTGVAIDSIADMRALLAGIPLDTVSTSMTINAPAALLLLLYELVAEEQGVARPRSRARSKTTSSRSTSPAATTSSPPGRACASPWTRSATAPSGCRASTRSRSPATTSARRARPRLRRSRSRSQTASPTCRRPSTPGSRWTPSRRRLSFFFNAHNNFFQEVAKFRAARTVWAEVMRERFGARDERSLMLRFHAQTGGSTLTAQQAENNIVRVAVQAFSAVCGSAQSLHTNAFDEALALPTEHSATIALRTQQILAAEAGAVDTADPLAGSYYVEALTDALADQARALIGAVDEMGGAVAAVEAGWVQDRSSRRRSPITSASQSGEQVIVGVNRYAAEREAPIELHRIDPEAERRQCERTAAVRAGRDSGGVEAALAQVRAAAEGDANLLVADPRRAARAGDGGRGVPGAARRVGHARRPARPPLNPRGLTPVIHRGAGAASAARACPGRSERRAASAAPAGRAGGRAPRTIR